MGGSQFARIAGHVDRSTCWSCQSCWSYRSAPDFSRPWIGRAGTSLIALSRLNRRHSETAGRAGDHRTARSAARVLERIVTQADGVPLFIEELTKAVLETSVDPGAAALTARCSGHAAGLADGAARSVAAARQVAQIGAVIGREFPHALLAASALLSEAQLARGLEELIASGLAFRRGAPPDAVYTFNHALTRDVAYASLLKSRRQICHQRIATVLKDFDDGYIGATEPELLATIFRRPRISVRPSRIGSGRRCRGAARRQSGSRCALSICAAAEERAELSAADRARIPELLMKLGNAQMQMDRLPFGRSDAVVQGSA